MNDLRIGTIASPAMLSGDFDNRKSLIDLVAESGLDHVFLADHVSFHTGAGMDGLINAATIAAMHPTLKVCVGVYLLALRHPVPVARQLATLSLSAPGRIILGIGIGGEDRHEMEVCGVDPATRGRQTNDSLKVIRALMSGKPYSFKGEFFAFEDALIKPAVRPQMPIIIGGRSNAALKRAGLYGDGWLGLWCSTRRYAEATSKAEDYARNAGRSDINWRHGLQIWVGIDPDEAKAGQFISQQMLDFYHVRFESFEKYSPYGTAEKIAEFLKPYRDAGCSLFNIKPCARSEQACIEGVARIRDILLST